MQHRNSLAGDLFEGALTGGAASVIADAVFVGIAALLAMLRGMDPWASTRITASFPLGPAAVEPPRDRPDLLHAPTVCENSLNRGPT